MKKVFAAVLIFSVIASIAIYARHEIIQLIEDKIANPVGGNGGTITNFNSFTSSTGVLVTTSSTLVSATTTSRMYLRISNLSSAAIYCSVRNSLPAQLFSGVTIFGSSTAEFVSDENPYTGPVYCIGHANASTSVAEK